MPNKKDLGQFFTTNSDYILKGFESFVKDKTVLDPFAGGGDLLRWAKDNGAKAISGLDIDPKLVSSEIKLNDSLTSIPKTTFNITNPPYLASNKMTPKQKAERPMDEYEDLYLLSMKKIIESDPDEGIIIIPVNFFSAENSDSLRKEFLTHFSIKRVNYFREQVFEDTTYNVVAFHYVKKTMSTVKQRIEIVSFPGGDSKSFDLEEKYNYRIAGKALSKILGTKALKTIRLTETYMEKNAGRSTVKALFNDKNTEQEYLVSPAYKKVINNNIIMLNCIDTNATEAGWISVEDVRTTGYSCLVGKNTSRNIAYIILPDVSLEDQEKIIPMFNNELNTLRKEYNSLFLTNFRDNDRKRVSFDFCYKLISYCYEQVKINHCWNYKWQFKKGNMKDRIIARLKKSPNPVSKNDLAWACDPIYTDPTFSKPFDDAVQDLIKIGTIKKALPLAIGSGSYELTPVRIKCSLEKMGGATFCREVEIDANGKMFTVRMEISDTKAAPNALDPDKLLSQAAADDFYYNCLNNYPIIASLLLANKDDKTDEIVFGGSNHNYARICFLAK